VGIKILPAGKPGKGGQIEMCTPSYAGTVQKDICLFLEKIA